MTTPPWPTITELRDSIRKQIQESPQLADALVEVLVQALAKSHGIPLGPLRPEFFATRLGSAYAVNHWPDGSFVVYRKSRFFQRNADRQRVVEYAAPTGDWYRWSADRYVDSVLAELGIDIARIQIHTGSILRREQPPC